MDLNLLALDSFISFKNFIFHKLGLSRKIFTTQGNTVLMLKIQFNCINSDQIIIRCKLGNIKRLGMIFGN